MDIHRIVIAIKKISAFGLAVCLYGVVVPAQAVDFSWSGFGTVGYAASDESFKYQRSIYDGGTLQRDSLFGAQLDIRFSQQWSATVQAKLAPSDHYDTRWQASLPWAFVSWRPTDDWLIRLGKIRLPLMLNTENNDVGATFDFARLPQEVYSVSPLTDVIGVGVSKTWFGESLDWVVEGYTGQAKAYWRFFFREAVPTQAAGVWYMPVDLQSAGLVLTVRNLDHIFRIGFHDVEVSRKGAKIGPPISFVPIGGGMGVYRTGEGGSDEVNVPVFTVGASFLLPADIRLTGEYASLEIDSVSEGLSRWGGYLALSRRFGPLTPYISYAKTRSTESGLARYHAYDNNVLPSTALTNTQKVLADFVSAYDQSALAIGASYRVSANSLVKAEWSRVRTGEVSSFIDAPSGGDSAHKSFNIFSFSYNFIF